MWICIFFLSFSLFAQQPVPIEKREKELKSVPPKAEEDSPFSSIHNQLLASVLNTMKRGEWLEPRPPGPVFNTCGSWAGAIKCYWAVLRMDNLTEEPLVEAEEVNNRLTPDGLQQELNYLKAIPHFAEFDGKLSFILLALEFHIWAKRKNLPDADALRLIPMAFELAKEMMDSVTDYTFHFTELNPLAKSRLPFHLYTLYRFFSAIGANNAVSIIQQITEAHFRHRNDGSPLDLKLKNLNCLRTKRAGLHREYLEERGLILPGYEDFELRTTWQDLERKKICEREYESLDLRENPSAGDPKDPFSTTYYAYGLLLLKAIGGKEAVRHFIRHNPPSHSEFALPERFFSSQVSPDSKNILFWPRIVALTILAGVYNDDEELQREWQSLYQYHWKIWGEQVKALDASSAPNAIFLLTEPLIGYK